jgi:vacuolar-type H+-ATPase subunit I/STV1
LEEIQKEINDQERFIREQNQKVAQAEKHYNNVKDKLEVLKVAEGIIPTITEQMGGERDIEMEMDSEAYPLVEENMSGLGAINIRQVAGVIEQEELPRLRKLIFRGTKGKSYIYTQTIEAPEGQEEEGKSRAVYIIVYWSGNHIRDKLYRICDSFTGARFDIPSLNDMRNEIQRTNAQIQEARNVLS